MKILFLGAPCERIEQHLINSGHSVIRTEDTFDIELLEECHIDFGISYNYTKIIRKPVIDWFAGKLINLHISYLPWNRGSYPNLWSFIDNTPRGVTIHLIDEGIDTGLIILQEKVEIDIENNTLHTSWGVLSKSVEDLFIRHSENILQRKIMPYPQENIVVKTHNIKDTAPYFALLGKKHWDTPLKELLLNIKYPPPPIIEN